MGGHSKLLVVEVGRVGGLVGGVDPGYKLDGGRNITDVEVCRPKEGSYKCGRKKTED